MMIFVYYLPRDVVAFADQKEGLVILLMFRCNCQIHEVVLLYICYSEIFISDVNNQDGTIIDFKFTTIYVELIHFLGLRFLQMSLSDLHKYND